jgi:hypothetical protein
MYDPWMESHWYRAPFFAGEGKPKCNGKSVNYWLSFICRPYSHSQFSYPNSSLIMGEQLGMSGCAFYIVIICIMQRGARFGNGLLCSGIWMW